MDKYVEFSGKDVDEAISNACKFFSIDRNQLEIEIVSGGSSGIFGLVGVKKAKIKAQKRIPDNHIEKEEETLQKSEPEDALQNESFEEVPEETAAPESEELPVADQELKDFIQDLVSRLIRPLAPEAEISIRGDSDPVLVLIHDSNNSNLILGRDGQTLSALQYLANRIIAKHHPGAARIQLDTENFLEKQSEKLEQSAFHLAQRAIKAGKTVSTRPLSSYHRRIVHLALQGESNIRTKSKGEGPMKRVLIMPKAGRKKKQQPHDDANSERVRLQE